VSAATAALASSVAFALAGACAGALLDRRRRIVAAGLLTAASGGCAAAAAAMVLGGASHVRVDWPQVLPLAGVRFDLDPLGALFVLVAGVMTTAAAVYGIGYCRYQPGLESRTFQMIVPLFALSLILVPAAASVSTLLVCWEVMALTSLVAVAADQRRSADVRDAALWYGVMTHLGFVVILIGLGMFAGQIGGESFAALRGGAGELSSTTRSAVFVLAVVGFGSKAGMVPLHVWLPRAHPEAPSHMSALMSAVMVNLGVYGIVRVGFDLLGGGPRWWGLVLLGLGAVSALFGILHAMVSSDLKRLLAYSTTENVGLILLGVGAALLFDADGRPVLAGVALAAALLQVVNHAVAKGLLFCAAGAVLHGTGTRDLDRLGGLMRRMPVTGATFAIGALAVAALPPLNGFVSEWALLQALVDGASLRGGVVQVVLPIAVAVIALTSGLAAATFVKALGTGFLARPRSEGADQAHEAGAPMRWAMLGLAGCCIGLALVPGMVFGGIARAVGRARHPLAIVGDTTLRLEGITSRMSPLLLACWLAVGVVVAVAVVRVVHGRRAARPAETWSSGRALLTPRMEYTATSFAEPLQRVFDDVLRPDMDIDVSHATESSYFVEAIRYRSEVQDAFERHVYAPITRGLSAWGRTARHVQNGNVLLYLAYGFGALVVFLVVAR
jgi:formate hydrogenlyase subunit 3/multisubunit Na+/H+ antiporter MnhD subunit